MSHPRFLPGVAEQLARAGRWLAADPADVVEFHATPHEVGDPDRSDDLASGGGDLAAGLRAWRDAIARGRRVAVARRALLVALALAALLLLARVAFDAPPSWLVAALPVVLFAGLCLRARHRLALASIARLLDQRLALAETVGTAWELSDDRSPATEPRAGQVVADGTRPSPAPDSLAQRVIDDGARLVWSARERAQVRPRPAGGEWTAVTAAVVVLAALVAIGPAGGGAGDAADTTRADGDAARAAGTDDAARRTTTGATVTTPAAAPPATSTLPTGARRPSTAPGQSGAPAAAERSGAAPQIAVRRQPTRGASGSAGSGSGRGSGGTAAAGSGRAGAAGGAVGRREQTASAAPAASLPAPSQVKEFSAQGRRATSPVASGTPAQVTGRPAAGERGAARSGTRGAGSQVGRR
ncbi:hypothetical protein VSS74_24115, partial [Conexibacter stalactiti]